VMRTDLNETAARSLMLETITRLAPGASAEFRLVRDGYRMTAARDRVVAGLAAGFAILALLLAAIGLYGVMAYHVVLRRREIGVRVAMGAAPASVMRLVLHQAIVVVVGGLVAGAVLSLGLARLIESLLFGVEPTNPAIAAIAVAILCAVTLAAGYLPARQAARIDPMLALREE
jgi:ABC-type antimicrobial peptide transport system permease subunit